MSQGVACAVTACLGLGEGWVNDITRGAACAWLHRPLCCGGPTATGAPGVDADSEANEAVFVEKGAQRRFTFDRVFDASTPVGAAMVDVDALVWWRPAAACRVCAGLGGWVGTCVESALKAARETWQQRGTW